MTAKLIEYARKPFPMHTSRWGVIISVSVFVSFFLVVFQPFGLQYMESDYKSYLLAGYGLVTFIVLVIDMFILPIAIPGFFREERWTVAREAMFLVWILLTIGSGNYAYSVFLDIVPWIGIKGFSVFVLFTFAIAIIPMAGLTVIKHNRLLKKHLAASLEINKMIGQKPDADPDNNRLNITSGNMTQAIEIPSSSLICIESEGNYIRVWYLEKGRIMNEMIRNTLKNIEPEVLGADDLFKCHRAFIINLSHIEKVSGNSQGYRLHLKYIEREIPVARNYTKPFREAISRKI